MFHIEMAEKLKLLGDKTRLTILVLLKDKEWCVCDLVEILNMSQPSVCLFLLNYQTLKLYYLY
jgi:ArsR family transcriptional regulator